MGVMRVMTMARAMMAVMMVPLMVGMIMMRLGRGGVGVIHKHVIL